MKKVIIILTIIVGLTIAALAVFVRLDGGKYLKKAAEKTYEVGEDLEDMTEKMKDKEEAVKEKLEDIKEVIKK